MFWKNSQILQRRSSKVLNIFNSTVAKLESINKSANENKDLLKEEIARLQEEHDAHDNLITSNNKVIGKITKFLSED